MGKVFRRFTDRASRFRGLDSGGATLLTNLHLPNFPKGGDCIRGREDRLRAGAELLLLSGGLRSLSHRGVSGGGGDRPSSASPTISQAFSFLLESCWDALSAAFYAPSAGFRSCCIKSRQSFHKEAEAADIPEIRCPAGDGHSPAGVPCERCWHGRPVLLQIPLPPRRAGAIPLSIANSGIRAALGKLFTWKFSILLSVIALSVLFYRPFCKWLCPLGAFYALFNRVPLPDEGG